MKTLFWPYLLGVFSLLSWPTTCFGVY